MLVSASLRGACRLVELVAHAIPVLAGGDEASTSGSVAVPPREVIIFFPGMPGCAKSALCKHLLGTDLERPKVRSRTRFAEPRDPL